MKYDFHFVLFCVVLCCCSNNSPAVVTAFPQPSEDFENGIFKNGNSTALPAVSNFSLDENSTAVPGNLFKNFTKKNETVKKSKKKTKKKKTPKRTDTKAAIAQALAATNRTRRHVGFAFGMASNSTQKLVNLTRRVDPQKVVVFCRKNQVRVTMVMAVIAFHREIYQILRVLGWQILTKPAFSQEKGKWVRIRRSISPVAVLKVIVVVDLIRRYQNNSNKERNDAGGDDDENSSFSPFTTAAALLLGRRGNPAVALLLSKFLAPSNSAYVPPVRQHYTFERLNERYTKDCYALDKVLNVKTVKPKTNSTKITDLFLGARKTTSETGTNYTETVIIMDLTGLDTSVSSMETLRDEVTFVLTAYQKHQDDQPPLEVVVLLESPGGSAADYSLASQQLMRLRNKGIPLTICVDKVAASGGYMIACAASPGKLFAAPFAVLGSIGVIGQTFNIHKTLEGWGVRPLVFRGGPDKAPVGLIGEVTDEGIAKVQSMVNKTHTAFKRHVAQVRPSLASSIEEISTGDIFLGHDALDAGLVDRIVTSDEYIGERIAGGARVLKLVQLIRPRYPFQKPTTATEFRRIEHKSTLSCFSSLDSFVEKAKEALDNVVAERKDGTALMAKAMGVKGASCSMPSSTSRS